MNLFNIKRLINPGGAVTFKGGIHPDYMKDITCNKPIINLPAPKTLVFPMQQHIGAMATPCVEVGERVLMGQKIAEAGGFVSANIHSSVSGTVVAIEPRMHPCGAMVPAIIIENDMLDEPCGNLHELNPEELTPEAIVNIVREAGIVGMGGATFPTHVKLSPPADKKIEYVIVNGAECEPCLTSDHRAMLETADEIISGLKIIMKVFGLSTGYIAVETNKADAIKHLTNKASMVHDANIKIVRLKTKYPQGSEKHLIKAVTNREVPPGKLPMDVGVIVDNIDTCAAIGRAVDQRIPLTQRIVTLGGDCVATPANLRVRIGTSFDFIFEKCGGFIKDPAKVVMGGPMMGLAVPDTDIPVIKGTSGILALSRKKARLPQAENCLRCGKCVNACPMNLLPNMLREAVISNNMEKLEKLNINDCLSCGSCTYSCPAEQNPLQYIKTGKIKLNKYLKEAKN